MLKTIFAVLNQNMDLHKALSITLEKIRKFTNIEAAAIRLEENGDYVYLDTQPFIVKDTNHIKKTKALFMSIFDPTNPILREAKINEIRNGKTI